MKPPADVPASELFQKLLEPLPSEVIDYPRWDAAGEPVGRLRIRVLTLEDHNKARLAAEKAVLAGGRTREDLTNPATREVVGDKTACEILAMACLHEKSLVSDEHGNPIYAQVFGSARDLERLPSAAEVAVLFSAYQLVQARYGPYECSVESEQDVSAWVARLAEGASENPLLQLQLPDCLRLTLLLATRLYSMYELLASQRSSLPSSLVSALDSFCTDTGLFGPDPVKSAEAGGAPSRSAKHHVTVEEAAQVAQVIGSTPTIGD